MEVAKPIVTFDTVFGTAELDRCLEQLSETYSSLHMESIGTSVLGQPLHAVRIGQGATSVFLNGAFHANEWITAPVVLRWMEQAASAWRCGQRLCGLRPEELFEQITVWAVPMVNPDGVDLVLNRLAEDHPYAEKIRSWNGGSSDFSQWKANIRGVDLNDQFPAHWEEERDRRAVEGPSPRDYTGEAPLTEPEAQAVAAFTEACGFRAVLAFHTQGEEIYWNYRGEEPPESERIAARMEKDSGYKAIKLSGSDAGYKDWFIHRWRRPGFTVELGNGVNPLPLSQLPAMYGAASRIISAAILAFADSNW